MTVVCSPSGFVFPKGNTHVTCTASDSVGNMSSCEFNITVYDVDAPVIGVVLNAVDLSRQEYSYYQYYYYKREGYASIAAPAPTQPGSDDDEQRPTPN